MRSVDDNGGQAAKYVPAINWNDLPDEMDKMVWEKLLAQFWVATRFPISNDLPTWRKLTDEERQLVMHVFAGLTSLDTIQGTVGAPTLLKDAITPQEEAVLSNIAFMEHIHAQSYSSIFQTLASTPQINEAFRWANDNDELQFKARTIQDIYAGDDPLKKKVASVMLESFLFYSGFFLPLWLNGQAKLPNTADIIKFIIRDEAVHGMYIGYKFQQGFSKLSEAEQNDMRDWVIDLLFDLMENEVRYTQDLYDSVGLTEEVKRFLRYNANKALMNLGIDPVYDNVNVNPIILTGMSLSAETHDFFSTTGSYLVGTVEELQDDDFADITLPPVVSYDKRGATS